MSDTQTTELVTSHPSAPRSAPMELSNRLGVKMQTMLDTVKAQCFRGGSNVSESQLAAFISVCWEIGANPLIPGQIYAYPTSGGGIIPMIGPDFVLTKLGTHPDIESWETVVETNESGEPIKAVCSIWRKGRERPLTYTALMKEWKVATNPNWNHRPTHMLWLRATKQAARQVINGIPMDEDERVIMNAEIVPNDQPRLAGDSAPTDNPTPTRRGRRPGAGIAGAAQPVQAPVIETPPPEPQSEPSAHVADDAEEIVVPPAAPKRTTIEKGEVIQGPITILKIEKSLMPATGDKLAYTLLAMECEGAFHGKVFSKILEGLEGMEGKTVNVIAKGVGIGGGKIAPMVTGFPTE